MSGVVTAKLQVQTPAGAWKEVGRCFAAPQIMADRLNQLKKQYNNVPVRAIDIHGNILDMR
jgi:hypothetical protein